MKIICSKQNLVEAVSNVSRAVSTKTSLPALSGILIKASGEYITLTGYDLELGISTQMECKVVEAGEIVLSAKLFFDMIRRMPAEEIVISSDEKLLTTVKSGISEFTILGIDPDEFPELPKLTDSESITLNQCVLKSMIDQTLFAVATSDSKPVHTGSMFEVEGKTLTVVSVDGYRLAMRKEPVSLDQELSFIVPGKTLSEVSKLIKDDDKNLEISVSRKHIVFHIHGYSIISRLLEGEFLDYKAAIPQNSGTTVKIGVRDFIDSIERTSLLISDRLKSPIKLSLDENMIRLSCQTAIGKAYDEVSCEIDGPFCDMGFNNIYLLDALKACGCDKVRLEINGPLSPMKVLPLESDSFLFLVLPVRLKNE